MSIKFNTGVSIHYNEMPPQAYASKVNNFFHESKLRGCNIQVKWGKVESDAGNRKQQQKRMQGQQQTVALTTTGPPKQCGGFLSA